MQKTSGSMVGESTAFLNALDHISQVAPLQKPVLLVGERGTGKEMAASRLHFLSERWGQEFLKLNCATLSDTLLDSELFGHEAGAFSGATRRHLGFFERADGGTLFLDELATASPQVQEKLLRLIEYGELTRVGGTKVIEVDVRLVAATNADLPRLAQEGKFRADLLDRLAFDVVFLPPLRARVEDIPVLAESFAVGMAKELGLEYFPGFTPAALEQLVGHAWPGNVRELKNVVERSVYRHGTAEEALAEVILNPFAEAQVQRDEASVAQQRSHQNEQLEGEGLAKYPYIYRAFKDSGYSLKDFIDHIECDLICEALSDNQHHQKQTSHALGISYHQLRAALRKYQIK